MVLQYGMKPGFAEKQFLKLRKVFFSAHAWTASNPHKINMWVDLGTWNIVFPNDLEKTESLQKINFSSSEKFFFSHAWTASNRTWNIVYPVTWWKKRRRESKLRPSSVKPRQAGHYATGALLSRNFAPECLYLLWLQRAGCSMVYREALKKCFCTLTLWTQTSPALQKNNFSGSKKLFFAH